MKKNLFVLIIALIMFPVWVLSDGCVVTVTDVIPDGRTEVILGTDTQYEDWEAGGSSTYTANEYEGYECKHIIVNDEIKVKSDTVEVQHDDFQVTDLGIKFVYKVAETPVEIPSDPAPASDPEPAPASDPEPAPAADPEPAPASDPQPEASPASDPQPETPQEPEVVPANYPQPEVVTASDPEPDPAPVIEQQPEVVPETPSVQEEVVPVDPEPEPVIIDDNTQTEEVVQNPEPEVVPEPQPEPEPEVVPEPEIIPEPEPEPVVVADPAPAPPTNVQSAHVADTNTDPVAQEPVVQQEPAVQQPARAVASSSKPRYKVESKQRDTHKIHIEYLDLEGKPVRGPHDIKIHDGDPVFYEATEIKGYVCVVRPDVYYSYPTGDQDIVFYYARADEMTDEMEDLSLPFESEYFKILKKKVKSQRK